MRAFRTAATVALALATAVVVTAPASAQRAHGRRRAAAASAPPNASAAFCRSKARDYAYEKHADAGQERLAFEKCMGR